MNFIPEEFVPMFPESLRDVLVKPKERAKELRDKAYTILSEYYHLNSTHVESYKLGMYFVNLGLEVAARSAEPHSVEYWLEVKKEYKQLN